MDFTHVSDITEICARLLKSDIVNEDFNVAPGREITIKELAHQIIQLMGADTEPEFVEKEVFVTKRRADNKKITDALGFKFEMGLEKGLGELIDHVRGNINEY